MQQVDIELLLNDNYIALLLLGGLIVLMFTFRRNHLPASRTFLLIAAVLFAMILSSMGERWATGTPERETFRIFFSIVHYVLQPLVIYLELILIMPYEKMRKLFHVLLALPLMVNSAIYITAPLQGTRVFFYDENYYFCRGPLGISIYIVTALYLLLLIIWSLRLFRRSDIKKTFILVFVAGIGVLTGVLEVLNFVSGHTEEAFVLGVVMFYMYLVAMQEAEIRSSLANKELELSRSELMRLKQQIKPHFVFNSLHIIKSLIRTDTNKAVQHLEDFSEYLRANLDVINSEGLISFEDELVNIQAYVALALADESKGINVEYDIQEDFFRLPPLTVEPLVENSIRHGIPDGGTVRISTESDETSYIIMVTDDGCGFPAGSEKEQKRTGIGIGNVRERLARLVGGTMDIQSDSSGTKVTIRIPKHGEAQI